MLIKIFCCNDIKDEKSQVKLETWLNPLERLGQVDVWYEQKMRAGDNIQLEAERHLRESDIVLLLVSPDFFASERCDRIQQQAMEWLDDKKISFVIPIIIRPCKWKQESIGKLQPLPKNEKPISTWRDRDTAWLQVEQGINDVIKEVNENFTARSEQPSDVREGFSFTGLYPTNGYRWDSDLRPAPGLVAQENIPDGPWLVSQAVGISEDVARYSIFEESNILRDFATLPPTVDAVKQFADRHGNLGKLVPLIYPKKVGQSDSILWAGESLQLWLEEIEEMNTLVTLWEMIRNRQVETLREHIIWRSNPSGVFFTWKSHSGVTGAVISSERIRPYLLNQWERGEVIRPALQYLYDEISKRLQGHVNPILFTFQKSEIEMSMVPDSLRSALYVLFLNRTKRLLS